METLDKGIDGKIINDLFVRKTEAAKAFETELGGIADILLDLVPAELSVWKEKNLDCHDFVEEEVVNTNKKAKELVEMIYAEMQRRGYLRYDLGRPEEEGFADEEALIAGMELLKTAWSGVLDIKIVPPSENDGDNYTSLHFSIAQ